MTPPEVLLTIVGYVAIFSGGVSIGYRFWSAREEFPMAGFLLALVGSVIVGYVTLLHFPR